MNYKHLSKWCYGLAIVTLVASILTPLYTIDTNYNQYQNAHWEFYSLGYSVNGTGVSTEMVGFHWITESDSMYYFPNSPLIVFLILGVVTIIGLSTKLVIARRRGRRGLVPQAGMLDGAIAVCAVLNPLLFFMGFGNTLGTMGFWYNDPTMGYYLGPNVGWYISILTLVLVMAGAVSAWKVGRMVSAPVSSTPLAVMPPLPLPAEERKVVPEERIEEKVMKPVAREGSGSAVSPMLLCGRCGESITLGAKDCPHCGVEITPLA